MEQECWSLNQSLRGVRDGEGACAITASLFDFATTKKNDTLKFTGGKKKGFQSKGKDGLKTLFINLQEPSEASARQLKGKKSNQAATLVILLFMKTCLDVVLVTGANTAAGKSDRFQKYHILLNLCRFIIEVREFTFTHNLTIKKAFSHYLENVN